MNENDRLLRELFQDATEAPDMPRSDEAFVQGVMQKVHRMQMRRLFSETAPWLLAVAIVAVVSWKLLPQLLRLPTVISEWPAALLPALSALSIGSNTLLPLLALLLALLAPALLDRLPRSWRL